MWIERVLPLVALVFAIAFVANFTTSEPEYSDAYLEQIYAETLVVDSPPSPKPLLSFLTTISGERTTRVVEIE